MLGSVAEAEDAVQETWLRYETSPTQPASPKAFLSAVVTRVSIDVLRSARVRREQYVGEWFPSRCSTDPYEDPARSAELADSVSMAALLLLERLTPLERAVFVLREVFGFGFAEVAAAVGRSEAACRQLAVRARRHMDVGRPRFEADRRERRSWPRGSSTRSATATSTDCGSCSPPTSSWSATAEARRPRWPGAWSAPTRWPGCSQRTSRCSPGRRGLEQRELNGQPGAILRDRDGKVAGTMTLDVLDGRIQTIRSMVNPDKLGHSVRWRTPGR